MLIAFGFVSSLPGWSNDDVDAIMMRELTEGPPPPPSPTPPTRTSSKNVISRYCKNFVITPSRSKWKVCINIAGKKLAWTVWLFWKKLKCFVRFSRPLHNLKFCQFTSLSGRKRQRNVPNCKTNVQGVQSYCFCSLRTVPTNSKVCSRGLLNMREKQILTSVIEIQKENWG